MAQPRTITTLDSLPPEIINSILDWVTLERPTIGETRPVRYDSLTPGEDWHTFTRNRRGLVSLCRASKQFCAHARPLLYRTAAIFSENSLVLFFRTMVEQPALGSCFTRSFSCHITLTTATRDVRNALQQHFPTFTGVYSFDAMSDRTPENVLTYILIRLPRLESLLIQVPVLGDPDAYSYNTYIYRTLLSNLSKLSATNWCQDCADLGFWPSCSRHRPLHSGTAIPLPRERPFTQLETLMLQGDPEMRQMIEEEDPTAPTAEYWGASAINHALLYLLSPKLHTLEISSDDGNYDFRPMDADGWLQPIQGVHPLRMIRHIYLHDSVACPRNLHYILQHAPDLETLYMTPRLDEDHINEWHRGGNAGDGVTVDMVSLDTALDKYGKNLRHLDVGWFEHHGYSRLIGQKGRLASLPRLKKLETLCVQLVVLYGKCKDRAGLLMPLASLLPPNLVELTLVDWWWTDLDAYEEMQDWHTSEKMGHYRSRSDYRTKALRSLINLANDSSQPKLKKVMLTCPIPWTWRMEVGIGLDFHFGEVKEAFAKRGVEFLVDEA